VLDTGVSTFAEASWAPQRPAPATPSTAADFWRMCPFSKSAQLSSLLFRSLITVIFQEDGSCDEDEQFGRFQGR